MTSPYYVALFCFSLGFALIMFLRLIITKLRRAQTKAEVAHILEEAQEKVKEIEDTAKARAEQYREQLNDHYEQESTKIEQRIEQIENHISNREADLEAKIEILQKNVSEHQSDVDIFENQINSATRRIEQKRQQKKKIHESFVIKLETKTETPKEQVLKDIYIKKLDEKEIEIARAIITQEEEATDNAEIVAKRTLTMIINRFARAYCPERGIGYLNFENDEQKNRVLGKDQENLRQVEKICGVDLAYDEQNNAVNIYGFDPVRRELGRATVDKMMSEMNINPRRIEQIAANIKKDLFQKILSDGNKIAKELRAENLNPEIKNMLGALRYRYSFTQNQYFHCAEVGFLCGLLAAELDVPITDARRAGLLHDIGKAMDHSIDGGHAVIGADFIKQHGESDRVVHAVRAHHFDEQPNTNLAFLVIAADAISGARPGARRSTVATYTQKIQDLQTIASGFNGVVDTHVLSAGREVRVYVDGGQIDDLRALDLSRQIAHKIENEMQYPGQIRVTVVRETQAVEYAK
ncbi:MAG: hypothetical protein A2Z20_05060 [Bdellovibrionales bacterium RBG_16_40_8]|nr:MAG: hypothetical protein A2Z20_05060 [Bdellovibrionales bacterium RBG_16_40_8]